MAVAMEPNESLSCKVMAELRVCDGAVREMVRMPAAGPPLITILERGYKTLEELYAIKVNGGLDPETVMLNLKTGAVTEVA